MTRTLPVIVPHPHSVVPGGGDVFRLGESSRIVTDNAWLGDYLAGILRPATGFALPIATGAASEGDIVVEHTSDTTAFDQLPGGRAEAYRLIADSTSVVIDAETDAGLFAGMQTLRQLLPVDVESQHSSDDSWTVPPVTIVDAPRYAYRGVMLDIARHFFGVETILSLIDRIAAFKFNHLHLHLSDDQGWRIEIPALPRLTERGAATEVDGGPGGFLTTEDYERIVRYAASRYITVVPEVDLPGHTNAALVAYPELAPAGTDVSPYEGTDVGFSTLDTGNEEVYRFVEQVVAHLATITPGPYLHIGGDESHSTTRDDYVRFLRRATRIVADQGKTPIGWHEIGSCDDLAPGTIGQYWSFRTPRDGADELARSIVRQGGALILSPADAAYLDMKPREDWPIGLEWADGVTPVERSADWEPGDLVPDTADAVLGVEAPLWTETVRSLDDIDALLFPRLLAIAEMAWTDAAARGTVHDVVDRVTASLPRLEALGIATDPA